MRSVMGTVKVRQNATGGTWIVACGECGDWWTYAAWTDAMRRADEVAAGRCPSCAEAPTRHLASERA